MELNWLNAYCRYERRMKSYISRRQVWLVRCILPGMRKFLRETSDVTTKEYTVLMYIHERHFRSQSVWHDVGQETGNKVLYKQAITKYFTVVLCNKHLKNGN